jgi:tRNA threonylcarbamoyladenosine modification (KEOPS) complex  Pcc1 subunit
LKSFKAKINISFKLLSDKQNKDFIKSIFIALQPDIKILEIPSVKLTANEDKNLFSIDIIAREVSSFRSTINSYLRLVKTANCCLIESFDI